MKTVKYSKLNHGDVYTSTTDNTYVWIMLLDGDKMIEHNSRAGKNDHTEAVHEVVFLFNIYKNVPSIIKKVKKNV